jgi:hypothetical protein
LSLVYSPTRFCSRLGSVSSIGGGVRDEHERQNLSPILLGETYLAVPQEITGRAPVESIRVPNVWRGGQERGEGAVKRDSELRLDLRARPGR